MGASLQSEARNKIKVGTDTEQVEKKPKCKPCCACPETRKARDACIVENGPEGCSELIDAHRKCMLKEGFVI